MLLLIKNVKLYAPDDMGTNDILICNEKIVNVGKKLQIRYEDLRVLDGEGMFAVPGFIDQHVHVTGGGGEGSFRTRVPELKLSDCVKAGVTTVLGLLGTDGLTRSVENLVAKTKALNEEGITAYCLTGSYGYPPITLTGNLKKDVAFIQEVLGVKVAISDHRSSHMTKEEFTRVASDVRVASLMSGKPGLIVCHLGNGKRGLGPIFDVLDDTELPIWHFRPTHAQKVREDAIAFGKRGGYVDYTAGARGTGTAKSVVGAIEAGIPAHLITVSTDSNSSQPRWNEKNEMVGITAAEHGHPSCNPQSPGFRGGNAPFKGPRVHHQQRSLGAWSGIEEGRLETGLRRGHFAFGRETEPPYGAFQRPSDDARG